jgi:hypothetical protein
MFDPEYEECFSSVYLLQSNQAVRSILNPTYKPSSSSSHHEEELPAEPIDAEQKSKHRHLNLP